jgi:2-C-methyl-D-erythritol 4-phosphate cytidylyltransferase
MIRGKSVTAIVPAAGKGRRMCSRRGKQFLELRGKPIIVHTLERLQESPDVDAIVIAADAANVAVVRELVRRYVLTKVVRVVRGGKVRQISVWNCLKVLVSTPPNLVLIHDAVRPFFTQKDIHVVLVAADRDSAAVFAVSPKETIKLSVDGRTVHDTLNRDTLWIAQTPQAFRFDLLYRAFQRARARNFTGTDDASLAERLGVKVRLVKGRYENIKITTPEDLEIARVILRQSQKDHANG